MRILIANDDGIYSPGILALAEMASKFGDVRIVAPDVRAVFGGSRDYRLASTDLQADADQRF